MTPRTDKGANSDQKSSLKPLGKKMKQKSLKFEHSAAHPSYSPDGSYLISPNT